MKKLLLAVVLVLPGCGTGVGDPVATRATVYDACWKVTHNRVDGSILIIEELRAEGSSAGDVFVANAKVCEALAIDKAYCYDCGAAIINFVYGR